MTDPRLPWANDPVDYALFCEKQLNEISGLLCDLFLARERKRPTATIMREIEKWLGDDWHVEAYEREEMRKAKCQPLPRHSSQ